MPKPKTVKDGVRMQLYMSAHIKRLAFELAAAEGDSVSGMLSKIIEQRYKRKLGSPSVTS